ncbi:hypothetical protein [Serratia ficaria]|uniref:hypothetical protein n=1 Tax=Serratia ficaria TaxID=61651 RepID=UPI00217BF397|nr:hypothetical protein [Serratia ficaria]CAI2092280.1 periplasmic protein disulfide isomerase I [Serratia ficaria]
MLNKLALSLFLLLSTMLNANAVPPYTLLDKTIPEAPEVVEFFSFYCPPAISL